MWRKSLATVTLLACATCCPRVAVQAAQSPAQSKISTSERLDVNRASLADLEKLPGITQIWAERIVRFRPYHAKSDLRNSGVIPARVYHRIEDLIVAHRQ